MWQALEQVRGELAADMKGGAAVAEADADLSAEIEGDTAEPEPAEAERRESLIGPNDPLAYLFAPEPEEPRGRWDRCEETGELVYYGSDPPEIWPEDDTLAAEDRAAESTAAPPAATPCGASAPGLVDAMVMLAERQLSDAFNQPAAEGRRLRRAGERQLLLVHLSEDRLTGALDAEPAIATAAVPSSTSVGCGAPSRPR